MAENGNLSESYHMESEQLGLCIYGLELMRSVILVQKVNTWKGSTERSPDGSTLGRNSVFGAGGCGGLGTVTTGVLQRVTAALLVF